MCAVAYLIIVLAFALVLLTSGSVVRYILSKVAQQSIEAVAAADKPEESVQKRLEIGIIIGKCENILVLALMMLEAYTALAIVFTAKTMVRKEEIEKNSMYFLAGTMINVSYSVLIGFVVKMVLPLIKC
ncbi:hypothetical protein [Paracnuella aquatica]|uniref:hypothetical protein n=1 Tax=Paracnuella aquatica TaxID=2268757 RepID=UPI000DEF76B0|nr:hypothetical protein [Paracnuella aquatica]RPD51452.1 hypothetical protein DRJ53_01860 [Paracnuella aquatica]